MNKQETVINRDDKMKQLPQLEGFKGAWMPENEARGLAKLLTAYANDLGASDIVSWGLNADDGYMYMLVITEEDAPPIEMRSYWGDDAVYVLKQDDDEDRLCACFNEYLDIQEQTKP